MLEGAVDVCVSLPRLALDRPFTYLLKPGQEAGTGSLVSVPFHGRTVKGWVLGSAQELPAGTLRPVRSVRGAVRFFDERTLELLRWVAARYLSPLSTVIERSHPPRVAGEERKAVGGPVAAEPVTVPAEAEPVTVSADALEPYGGADRILVPGGTAWLRPLPGQEAAACVAAVAAAVARGRQALVLVPEAEPVAATAAAVLEAFGERATAFLGGDARQRYRTWLDVQSGRFDVVVATRPGVFSPLRRLGLVWISREVHPAHREDRSPYYHVREIAMARAPLEGASCVLCSFSPSVDTAAGVAAGAIAAARPPRALERAQAPLVETAPQEAEDRSVRLRTLLSRAGSAALIVSRRGYGVARVCRACGEPAACASCGGPIVMEEGRATCRACGRPGRCANCGRGSFGIERGGTERIAEWAARAVGPGIQVVLEVGEPVPPEPQPGRVLVGTAAAVKDVGPRSLDLVAILDADRGLGRAGPHAEERALATWMEAATWAAPRTAGGRVLVHTRHPARAEIQALVRWEPVRALLEEGRQRAEAGFPPNHPVFRLEGRQELAEAVAEGPGRVVVSTSLEGRTVCLVTVPPARMEAFRAAALRLVGEGVLERVEAEPQP